MVIFLPFSSFSVFSPPFLFLSLIQYLLAILLSIVPSVIIPLSSLLANLLSLLQICSLLSSLPESDLVVPSSQLFLISAYVSLLLQGPIQMLSPVCFSNFIKLSVLWIPIAVYLYSSFLIQSTFFHIVQLFKSMCISSDCKFHESLWYNLFFGSSYSHTFLT